MANVFGLAAFLGCDTAPPSETASEISAPSAEAAPEDAGDPGAGDVPEADAAPAPGFEPLTGAQDDSLKGLQIERAPEASEQAVAEVRFEDFGQPVPLAVALKAEGGQWRVDDIVYGARAEGRTPQRALGGTG